MQEAIVPFFTLPTDIHLLYMRFLAPKNLAALSRVSRGALAWARNNDFWKEEFTKHFPHLMPTKPPQSWYALFAKTTLEQYPKLSKIQRTLFFLSKEDLIDYLLNGLQSKVIRLDDLVESSDKSFLTPLDWIIRKGYQSMLNEIFLTACTQFGFVKNSVVNHKAQDKRGWCATHWAVMTNQDEATLLKYLDEGIDKSYLTQTFGTTPLHIAAKYGLKNLIRLLKDNGCGLNRLGEFFHGNIVLKQAALHLAATKGHVQVVQTLLDLGADPSLMAVIEEQGDSHYSNDGRAIHLAARNNQVEVVKLLLARGCSPFENDPTGYSALLYAMEFDYKELFALIAQTPVLPNAHLALNHALFQAVRSNFYHYIEPLLKLGADPKWRINIPNHYTNGRCSIDLALSQGDAVAIKALCGDLENKALYFKPQNYRVIGAINGARVGLILVIASLITYAVRYGIGKLNLPRFFGIISCFIIGMGVGALIGYQIGRQYEKREVFKVRSLLQGLRSQSQSPVALPVSAKQSITPYLGQTFLGGKSQRDLELGEEVEAPGLDSKKRI